MWNKPTKEQLAKLPKLYATEQIDCPDKVIYLRFFIGGCNWYVAEYNGEDIFFGFVNLNDPSNAEWGYFSLEELDGINFDGLQVDNDLSWEPKKFSEINLYKQQSLRQKYFTKDEALKKVGKIIETRVDFSGVPKGTSGTVVRADATNGKDWLLAIQWHLPHKKTTAIVSQISQEPFFLIRPNKPLIDWFNKSEYTKFIKELAE